MHLSPFDQRAVANLDSSRPGAERFCEAVLRGVEVPHLVQRHAAHHEQECLGVVVVLDAFDYLEHFPGSSRSHPRRTTSAIPDRSSTPPRPAPCSTPSANLADPNDPDRRQRALAARGRRLVAFFGCMYYAALRPSEALALTVDDLELPDPADPDGDGWGHLFHAHNSCFTPTIRAC
ncbi:MAG: hypothetical protein V9F00_04900 [Nocardioides sp.]